MNDEVNYKNNPLHGVSLKNLLIEMVDYYGFEILFAYLNINCFKTKPSIDSSVKFLKKTDWAREKVEAFYMYEYKNLPRASSEQFLIPPRDRIVPEGQVPGEPAELSLEDAARLREKREKKAATHGQRPNRKFGEQRESRVPNRSQQTSSRKDTSVKTTTADNSSDPWANWKNK